MRNFIGKFVTKLRTFFYGRNGFDDLAKVSLMASLVLFLVYGFMPIGSVIKLVFSILTWVLMGYAYFRILSKNIYKRVAENRKYVEAKKMAKTRWNQRKTHKFYRCPKCKTWLRVPKGRGRITITCATCSHKFDKKT